MESDKLDFLIINSSLEAIQVEPITLRPERCNHVDRRPSWKPTIYTIQLLSSRSMMHHQLIKILAHRQTDHPQRYAILFVPLDCVDRHVGCFANANEEIWLSLVVLFHKFVPSGWARLVYYSTIRKKKKSNKNLRPGDRCHLVSANSTLRCYKQHFLSTCTVYTFKTRWCLPGKHKKLVCEKVKDGFLK